MIKITTGTEQPYYMYAVLVFSVSVLVGIVASSL
jgi:hypothetical protein